MRKTVHLRDLTYPLNLYFAEKNAETNERLRRGKERERERMRVRQIGSTSHSTNEDREEDKSNIVNGTEDAMMPVVPVMIRAGDDERKK